MMVAASAACGKSRNIGVNNTATKAMLAAVNTLASWVRAPASKFTTERARPPVTGKPLVSAAATFAAPRPTSSWFASTRSRRLAARVWATEMDSTNPYEADQRRRWQQFGPRRRVQSWQRQRWQPRRYAADHRHTLPLSGAPFSADQDRDFAATLLLMLPSSFR